MSCSTSIRSASEQDIEGVLALWKAAGVGPGITDTHADLLVLLAGAPHSLLLAQSGAETVGTLIAAWDGWRASFYRLAVHPTRRRQGIARALVDEGERLTRARGAKRLTAIVAESDAPAMAFWRAAGYTAQADRLRFIRDAAAWSS